MQVYRGMDIGTAKPDQPTQDRIRHHLIDIAEPSVEFAVAQYQQAGLAAMESIASRARPVIAGGSGLHFRSLVDPMTFAPSDAGIRAGLESLPIETVVVELLAADPDAAAHVDLANPRRVVRAVEIHRLTGETPSLRAAAPESAAVRAYEPRLPLVILGVDPGEALRQRIIERFDRMLAAGLEAEVARLGPRLGRTARQAVGYKELLPVVAGESTLPDARDRAIQATVGLAKRQRTFFRRDPRIRWLPWHHDAGRRREAALTVVAEELQWTS